MRKPDADKHKKNASEHKKKRRKHWFCSGIKIPSGDLRDVHFSAGEDMRNFFLIIYSD